MEFLLYCDGGLRRDPPAGGAGLAVFDSAGGPAVIEACRHWPGAQTNQQMEIEAAVLALEAAAAIARRPGTPPGAVFVARSDSAYVVNCLRQGWWQKWMRNGWTNSSGEPVKNAGHWRRLLAAWRESHDRMAEQLGPSPWRRLRLAEDAECLRASLRDGAACRFEKVKGHSGDARNDLADALAARGANGEEAWTTR